MKAGNAKKPQPGKKPGKPAAGENEHGDADDTMYIGGTPLFDETTGKQTPRKDYVPTRPPKKRP